MPLNSYYRDVRDVTVDEAEFLATHPNAMVYHQPAWLLLIKAVTRARAGYVFLRDEVPVGVMPLCEREGRWGVVANSSAYFGSHGGALMSSNDMLEPLMDALRNYLTSRPVLSLNIIDPLFASAAGYDAYLPVVCTDEREGQYIDLTSFQSDDDLMASFNGFVRSNLRRKALKSGIVVERDESLESLQAVAGLHFAEMSAREGGVPKSEAFFSALARLFPGAMRIYVGRIDGQLAAALIVVCWREWVEYLVPVFDQRYRDVQPSTAVLYRAMCDCLAENFRWWNFGGTWKTQHGVRQFKASWGAKTQPYRYSIVDFGGLEKLRSLDRSILLNEYSGFYVFPF